MPESSAHRGHAGRRLARPAVRTLAGLALAACCVLPAGCASPGKAPAGPAATDESRLRLDQLRPTITKPVNQPDADKVPDPLLADVEAAEKFLADRQFSRVIGLLAPALKCAGDNPRVLRVLGLAYAGTAKNDVAIKLLTQAGRAAPDDIELQVALGRLHAAKRQRRQAILAFRKALACSQAAENSPAAAEALLWLGNLLNRQRLYAAALDSYTDLEGRIDRHGRELGRRAVLKALARRPERLMMLRGELLSRLGRFAEAARLLERSFRYDRTQPRTARLLMEALAAAGQFDKAESLLLEMAGESVQRRQLTSLAEKLCLAAADRDLPVRIARALHKRQQLDGRAAGGLAKLALRLGGKAQAAEILSAALTAMPGEPQAATLLASIYAEQGKHIKALRVLAGVVRQDCQTTDVVRRAVAKVLSTPTPADIEGTAALAASRQDKDDWPGRAAMYYLAGLVAEARQEPSLAGQQYRRSLATDRSFMPAYESLVDIYLARKRHQRVERLLKQAEQFVAEQWFRRYLKGKVALARGRAGEAAEQLSLARAGNPRHLPTLLLLGRTYWRLGKGYRAVAVLAAALQLAPDNEQAHRTLFDVYVSQGRYRDADSVVRMLMSRLPGSPAGRILQAKLLLQTSRPADARKIIAELREQSPDDAEVALLEIQAALADQAGPLEEKRFARTAERLAELIRRDPSRRAAKLTLAELFDRQGPGARGKAVAIWQELYDQTDRDTDVAKAYARALFGADRLAEAEDVLGPLVEAEPRDLASQRLLLQTLVKRGRADQAASHCRRVQKVLDDWLASGKASRRADSLRAEKIRFYAAAALYQELAAFARNWADADPDNSLLKRMVVKTLADAGRDDLAHQLLDEWIVAAGAAAHTYRQMKFSLYLDAGRLDLARDFAVRWTDGQPSFILPRLSVLTALIRADQYDLAQELTDHWVRKSSATQPARRAATLPAGTASRPATLPTRPARPAQPMAVATWSREWSVRLLVARHKYAEALSRLEEYCRLEPGNQQLLLLRSTCLAEMGRADEALAVLIQAHEIDPAEPGVSNDLGYMYVQRGTRLDEAERMIRLALAAMPRQIAFQDSLAWLFYKRGRFAAAGRIFESILARTDDPARDHPVIFDHAGDAMWRLGRTDQAVKLWRHAVELAEKERFKTSEVRQVLAEGAKKVEAAQAGRQPDLAPLAEGHQPTPQSD